jgi:hypothetical protein
MSGITISFVHFVYKKLTDYSSISSHQSASLLPRISSYYTMLAHNGFHVHILENCHHDTSLQYYLEHNASAQCMIQHLLSRKLVAKEVFLHWTGQINVDVAGVSRAAARGLGATPLHPSHQRVDTPLAASASPTVAWFPIDVEAGAVAAVNTLASHSGPSVADAAALLHQLGEQVSLGGPAPRARRPYQASGHRALLQGILLGRLPAS